ncbi:MAG: hypothetical protein ACRDIZ_09700 [Actinomycetota bacterium]
MANRVAIRVVVAALLLGLVPAGPAMAAPADCFTDFGGVIQADQVVGGNLRITRQVPGVDPTGLGRGSICLILGTVRGNVTVVDKSDACAARPPFTAVELAGGTVEGNAASAGNQCAMVWLRDGTWIGGNDPSTVRGNVIIGAPGNLGFLGNGEGALVKGNAILQAPGSGLFATGASTTNRVDRNLMCQGGAPAGGSGSGSKTDWDGLEGPGDLGPDGTIGGRYIGC